MFKWALRAFFVSALALTSLAFTDQANAGLKLSMDNTCGQPVWVTNLKIDGSKVNANWNAGGQDGGSLYGDIDSNGNVDLTGNGNYVFIKMTGKLAETGGSGKFSVGGAASCEGSWTAKQE